MNVTIPESVGDGVVVLPPPWPTRVGNVLGRALGGAFTVVLFTLWNPYWWILLIAVVLWVLDDVLRRQRFEVRISRSGIIAGPVHRTWPAGFRYPTTELRWNQIVAIDVVDRWWGRQARLAAPPALRFPREIRSWRWLPDRRFDRRLALIRRTWLDAGPMPLPPAPATPTAGSAR